MKKLILAICSVLPCFMGINAQEIDPETGAALDKQEQVSPPETHKLPSELRRDSETLIEFIRDLRVFRELENDSESQRKVKREKIRKLLVGLNRSNASKRIDLYATKVLSADRFQVLTKRGTTEYARYLEAIKRQPEWNLFSELVSQNQIFKKILLVDFWKSSQARCSDCFQDSKKFLIRYAVFDMYNQRHGMIIERENGDRESINVLIMREISSEDEFIAARIDSFQAVTGNISAIFYSGSRSETLIIYVE